MAAVPGTSLPGGPAGLLHAFLYQLRTHAALRMRLVAILVLALLASGLLPAQVRPTDAHHGSDRLRGAAVQARHHATPPGETFGRKRGVRGEASTRRSVAHGRPPLPAAASTGAQAADEADAEGFGPPGGRLAVRPRRTIPADGKDGDPEPAPLGYRTRAPPAPGLMARASALA